MDRAEPSEPIRKLTTSNTKKEMLAAYNELLKKLQDKPEKILDAQKRIEQKAVERAVQAADALSTEAVVKQIGILKAEHQGDHRTASAGGQESRGTAGQRVLQAKRTFSPPASSPWKRPSANRTS